MYNKKYYKKKSAWRLIRKGVINSKHPVVWLYDRDAHSVVQYNREDHTGRYSENYSHWRHLNPDLDPEGIPPPNKDQLLQAEAMDILDKASGVGPLRDADECEQVFVPES